MPYIVSILEKLNRYEWKQKLEAVIAKNGYMIMKKHFDYQARHTGSMTVERSKCKTKLSYYTLTI